ncbi:MAG: hypothetical protein MJZ68_08140, partial [archaeon]|nr:hypothetical protein [archaeon]
MNAKLNTIIALLVALVAALAIVSVSDSSDADSDYQVDISVPHDGPEYYAKVSFEFSEDYQSFYLHLNLNKGYMTSIEGLKITMYVNGDEHSIECINMPPPEFPVDYNYGVLDYMSDISEYHVPIHIEVFVDGIETAPFAIEQVLPAEVTTTAPASAKYKDGVNFTVDSTGYQNVVVTVKSKDPAVPFDVVLTPAGGVYSFNMP